MTIKHVAEAAGISITTASRALSGRGRVSESTRQRTLEIAAQLGYEPNELARQLRGGSSSTIALLVPDITNPFYPELIKGAQAVAKRNNYVLLLGQTDDDKDTTSLLVNQMRRRNVDGIGIVGGHLLDEQVIEQLAGLKIVVVDRLNDVPGAAIVGSDQKRGGQIATEHLIALGHEDIAFIGGPEDLDVAGQRCRGFNLAMLEAGLAPDFRLMVAGDFTEASGRRAMTSLLARRAHFTAVFAANDLMAIGAMQALDSAGLSVPDDISVVGFDDIHLAEYVRPGLTTVRQQIEVLGQRAAELLIESEDEDIAGTRHELDVELIARGSTRRRPRKSGTAHRKQGQQVTILGSLNVDQVTEVPHFPFPGETVLAGSSASHAGGKGANQAVAVARAGISARMIGAVGSDSDGEFLLACLVQDNIDIAGVQRVSAEPTGRAIISVQDDGENTITVVSGANHSLDLAFTESFVGSMNAQDTLLIQLEIPLEHVEAAARSARLNGARVILNAAPAQHLGSLLDFVDVLVVNEQECLTVGEGEGVQIDDDAVSTAQAIAAKRSLNVVVTLGAEGAAFSSGGEPERIGAPAVNAVDTTGAGDTFTGYLTAALHEGKNMRSAVALAIQASALAVTRRGAQPGIPTRSQIEDHFTQH